MSKRTWFDNFWVGWFGAIALAALVEVLTPGETRETTWWSAILLLLVLGAAIWISYRNRAEPTPAHTCKRGALNPQEGCTQPYMHPLADPVNLSKGHHPGGDPE